MGDATQQLATSLAEVAVTDTNNNEEKEDTMRRSDTCPMSKPSPVEGPDPSLCHSGIRSPSDLASILGAKEAEIARLETILAQNVSHLDNLRSEAQRRRTGDKEMKLMIEQYEQTINDMIGMSKKEDTVGPNKELELLRQQLASAESAFAEVHRKYERSKEVLDGLKHNEVVYTEAIEQLKVRLEQQEKKYELLKEHAEETLNRANAEIERITAKNDVEVARLEARIRKSELDLSRLEKSVQQKESENRQLTEICDELIAKIGQ